ncbi:hypothetical protein PDE_08348 [Penicillium oxalicum 114-2]|uniref:CCHC-type domain-containing protein n=1 Tax=Penicillium oxalicum (strain 114-2 / CGMCC 5302) TaxID=933388 RepID=S7ZXA9_PENO1|nr:hypothetical protein PDE_08348 [Penicillium oxalicum 114-2]
MSSRWDSSQDPSWTDHQGWANLPWPLTNENDEVSKSHVQNSPAPGHQASSKDDSSTGAQSQEDLIDDERTSLSQHEQALTDNDLPTGAQRKDESTVDECADPAHHQQASTDDGWATDAHSQEKSNNNAWGTSTQATATGWEDSDIQDQDVARRNSGENVDIAHEDLDDEPRKCFNCGQPGHSKAGCEQPAKPRACFNCGGHEAVDCVANRKLDYSGIPDYSPEEAWAILKGASHGEDCAGEGNTFEHAIRIYSKAVPDATFVDIEKRMREENCGLYLIAEEFTLQSEQTLIDLQGRLGCQYRVYWSKNPRPDRLFFKAKWPRSAADNLDRLADAGLPAQDYTVANTQDRRESARPEINCPNCETSGHRLRDCPLPRVCQNCGDKGHRAAECSAAKKWSRVRCNQCGEMGHTAKGCPGPARSRGEGEQEDTWGTVGQSHAEGSEKEVEGLCQSFESDGW